MAAKFICPACWHAVDFADDWVGKTAKCPECHARGPVTLVPDIVTTSQETTDLRVAASVEPPQSQPPPPAQQPPARRAHATEDPKPPAVMNRWHRAGILVVMMSPLPWLVALNLEVPAGVWCLASATCFAVGGLLVLVGMRTKHGIDP
jgi:hypothetical protein